MLTVGLNACGGASSDDHDTAGLSPREPGTCDETLVMPDGVPFKAVGQGRWGIDLCEVGDEPCLHGVCPTIQDVISSSGFDPCSDGWSLYSRPVRVMRCVNEAKGIDHDVVMHYECDVRGDHWYAVFDRSGALVQRVEQRRLLAGVLGTYRAMMCCGGKRITANLSWGRFSLECEQTTYYDPRDFFDAPEEACDEP